MRASPSRHPGGFVLRRAKLSAPVSAADLKHPAGIPILNFRLIPLLGDGMSETETPADHSFFWRKLHSFTGIFAVGAFLAEHFWSYSSALVSIDGSGRRSRLRQRAELCSNLPERYSADGIHRRSESPGH